MRRYKETLGSFVPELLRMFCIRIPIVLLLFSGAVHGAGIFNEYQYSDGNYRPATTYEEDRLLSGNAGNPETLSFRLSRYGSAAANMPLLVQVHEWGGNFARMEDIASYVPGEYEFVMLYFQYKPSSGNEDDWWFGTHWGGVCRMWAHEAVMDIVREAVSTSLIPDNLPGVTIDPNRVYLFGHSIGGTGAWQLGVRNPDVFAAVHAHSGFARFTPPVGPFQVQFEDDIVGAPGDGITIVGDDALSYPARDYSNLAWWLTNYRDPGWETTFMNFTAGTADDVVPAASGGDLMQPVLADQRRGYYYYRHGGGHSDDCFVQMNWMWNFRLNQSFLDLSNHDVFQVYWEPGSITDTPELYEIAIRTTGASTTADATPRRLQSFIISPGSSYDWENRRASDNGLVASGTVTADANGLITVAGFSVSPGGNRLRVWPAGQSFPARINFQPSSSAVPEGHLQDDGSGYGNRGAYDYGWL